MTWERDGFILSDNVEDQDVQAICNLLRSTYWAGDRTFEQMQKVVRHSLCFSLTLEDELVGFVRIISDYTKMSWVSDMVVKEDFRGLQLGQWMMHRVMQHPDLKHTQFALQTKDAHSFYAKLGFARRTTLMSTSVAYLSTNN